MRWAKLIAPKTRRFAIAKRRLQIGWAMACGFLLIGSGMISFASSTLSAASLPPIAISVSNPTVNEGDGSAVFTVTESRPSGRVYNYFTVDGTAISPQDYLGITNGSFDAPSCQINPCSKSISIRIVDDSEVEKSENFTLVITWSNNGSPVTMGSGQATIIDNDTAAPIPPPPPITTPTPPPPTNTPRPPASITTPPPSTDPTPETPTAKPTPTPEVLSSTTETPPPTPSVAPPKNPERAKFVTSVTDPSQLPKDFKTIAKAILLAMFLVLLIFFPADLFNGTLQTNYEEVSGWFKLTKLRHLHERVSLHKLPIGFSVAIYAALAALLNSQLSPGFGLNRASYALLLGMFLALIITASVYDLVRGHYLKSRYNKTSRLRTHAIGLGTGAILVIISRMANFLPGYLYGLFTGLVFHDDPTEEQDGEGLAVASVVLLAMAIGGWFALVPVRQAIANSNAGFPLLVLEATLATLWVSTLGAIVFGLIPLRYLYGEALKKWNTLGWSLIYGAGMVLFVYTLLDPAQSFYGKSDQVSLFAVLALFFGFGIFSVAFWGYFRYRPARLQPPKQAT